MMSGYALKQPAPEELKKKYISGSKLITLRSLYTLIWSHLNISVSSFGNNGKLSCVIKFFENKNLLKPKKHSSKRDNLQEPPTLQASSQDNLVLEIGMD